MKKAPILAALAAGVAMAAAPALAAEEAGILAPQALKAIARAQCVKPNGSQATYGVRPGDSWMLDLDTKYSDPPEITCNEPTGETYGILPHGQSWMVDYAGR